MGTKCSEARGFSRLALTRKHPISRSHWLSDPSLATFNSHNTVELACTGIINLAFTFRYIRDSGRISDV